MIVEQKIAGILATVPNCIFYPVQLPDPGGTIPAAFGIYSKVGGEDFNTLIGDVDISRPRMQISVFAINYSTVKTLEVAVNTAMQVANDLANAAIDARNDPLTATGALPNISVSVPVDGYEQDTRRFYVHMDFYCWVKE